MATMVDLTIAGRTYQVACREGEEDNLRAAARLVDGKSREALSGLGTLSEARQFLFASLLLADQLIDKGPEAVAASAMPIGKPGWPLFAASTASIARPRMALARARSVGCMLLRLRGSAHPRVRATMRPH